MPKSADAFRTISEVADWLETPAHVLRFWESKFAQVKPVKRAGGRRYYRRSDMELLGGIKRLLHEEGMTIKGVQKLLRERGTAHVAAMSPALDDLAVPLEAEVVQLKPRGGLGAMPAPDGSEAGPAVVAATPAIPDDAPALSAPGDQPPAAPAEMPLASALPGNALSDDDLTADALSEEDLPEERNLFSDLSDSDAAPEPAQAPPRLGLVPDSRPDLPAAPEEAPLAAAPRIAIPADPEDAEITPAPGILALLAARNAALPGPVAAEALALARRLASLS